MLTPLLSIASLAELPALDGLLAEHSYILDLKSPANGSLAAPDPSFLDAVSRQLGGRVPLSVALGDVGFEPGTIALAGLAAMHYRPAFVKVGLFRIATMSEALEILMALQRAKRLCDASTALIAASYADYREFGGLAPELMIQAAAKAGVSGILLDTARKDGRTLFDHLQQDELKSILALAQEFGLQRALAGSLSAAHVPLLVQLGVEYAGFRGALTSGDRKAQLDRSAVIGLLESIRRQNGAQAKSG